MEFARVIYRFLLISLSFEDFKRVHALVHAFLKFIKINYQLVSVLVKRRPIFVQFKALSLQFLIYNRLYLLHGL